MKFRTLHLFMLFVTSFLQKLQSHEMYFVIATDDQFLKMAVNLIATIYKYNYENTKAIAVFDIGLTNLQREFLNRLEKVTVYDVELTHPDLLKVFLIRNDGKTARGWYSWKPVVMKQALDLFPYAIYTDAGISLTGPSDKLFEHIKNCGYFFISSGHKIRPMTPRNIIRKFDLHNNSLLLDSEGISAGFQGISPKIYKDYILPLYEMTKDITNFADEGTAPGGFEGQTDTQPAFGYSRHDQTLSSILVRKLNYHVFAWRGTENLLTLNSEYCYFNPYEFFIISRGECEINQNKKFLRFKKCQPDPLLTPLFYKMLQSWK